MKSASQMAPEEIREVIQAGRIAAKAVRKDGPEWSTIDCEGIEPALIAEQCEQSGERFADFNDWQMCARAHRAACWFWRIAAAR